MKRILCLLLTLLFLPVSGLAALEDRVAAQELDVILKDNRTELDQAALRDNSDTTGYDPRSAKSFIFTAEIPQETPLYQVFLRMNSLPDSAELQVPAAKNKWETVASATTPGAEFVLSSKTPITGSVRIIVRYEKSANIALKECRLFGRGVIPSTLHKWRFVAEPEVLLLTDALTDVDAAALESWCGTGSTVAVCALTKPTGDILSLTDALWEAGLRATPLYGSYRAMEGDAAKKIATWNEKPLVKTLTGWVRYYQPLLAVSGSEVVQKLLPTALANACDYNYETEFAASHGLWIVPESCHVTDDVPARIAALAPRSYDALRAYCAESFASAQHGDTATIPYPADRLADGYLTQGEFLHEDPDGGLWAYLSPTVRELTIFRDGIYQPRPLIDCEVSTSNKYLCFSSGDHEYYEAHNETITDGSAILIIKESYGNAFIPMLVDSYEYVYAIDYRFWNGDLRAFAEEKGIDTVVFLNNLMATGGDYTVRCLEKLVD